MKHVFAVSAYQDSPYLPECLESLLSQKEKSDIFLCTSTPSEYLEQLSEQYGIPCYVREGTPSLREDWNFCLRCAEAAGADLVTVAHQDDCYGPLFSREVKETFRKAEAGGKPAVLAFTGVSNINAESKPIPGTAEKIKKILRLPLRCALLNGSRFWKKASLSFGNSIPCPSCTYNLREVPGDVFTTDYRFVADWAAFLSLAELPGRICCIEKPLLSVRIHNGAETARTIRDGERQKEEAEIFRRLHPAFVAKFLMHFYRNAQNVYVKDSTKN